MLSVDVAEELGGEGLGRVIFPGGDKVREFSEATNDNKDGIVAARWREVNDVVP